MSGSGNFSPGADCYLKVNLKQMDLISKFNRPGYFYGSIYLSLAVLVKNWFKDLFCSCFKTYFNLFFSISSF
jgi:hypothetical protein